MEFWLARTSEELWTNGPVPWFWNPAPRVLDVSWPSFHTGSKSLTLTEVSSPLFEKYGPTTKTVWIKYISPRKCWWIYHNWAIHLLKSRMAFIANCSLYGRKETGSLISLVNFFSFMAPETALNIPSAFLMQFGDGYELGKCYGGRFLQNHELLAQEETLGRKRLWEPTPGNVPCWGFTWSLNSLQHQGRHFRKSISQWANYLQWFSWNDFEMHWVFKSQRSRVPFWREGPWSWTRSEPGACVNLVKIWAQPESLP